MVVKAQTMSTPADVSHFLLDLYRLSYERSLGEFQDAALRLVQQVLPFDSAAWGTAIHGSDGVETHNIHLHKLPEDILSAYERLRHLDTAAQAASRRPCSTLGIHAKSWFSSPEQAPMLDYGRRFQLANYFIVSGLDSRADCFNWVTLYRADENHHCRENERALLETVSPHLMQALAINRLSHLERVNASPRENAARAISDLRGVLHHMDPTFCDFLRREWISWSGGRLPPTLLDHLRQGQPRWVGRDTVVSSRVEHGLLFLDARERCPADNLTPREHLVAELVARGLSHKDIAQQQRRSPATIRNQVRAVYEKLKVNNAAGLIKALRMRT